MSPKRVQRQRTKGWRMPEGCVYVGRGSRYENPFRVGREQVRMPARDGGEWEYEGRLYKTSGERHSYFHGDGRITWHLVQDATAEQCVLMFAEYIGAAPLHHIDWVSHPGRLIADGARERLRGRDLACWCPIEDEHGNRFPCHADVLLELANGDQ